MLNPMRDKKIEGKNRGEGRNDTCDYGLSRSCKVKVCKYIYIELLRSGAPANKNASAVACF